MWDGGAPPPRNAPPDGVVEGAGEGIRLPEGAVVGTLSPPGPPTTARGPMFGGIAPTLDGDTCAQRVEAVNSLLREVHDALRVLGRDAHLAPALADATEGVRLRVLGAGRVRLDARVVWVTLERHPAAARPSLLSELLDSLVARALEVAGDHLPAAHLDALLARVAGWTRRTGT